MVLNC